MMGNYTLLADDNCAYSKRKKLYDSFRAHIVFNVITNGSITFSDNQVMSAPNLRLLMRHDGVIRELLKEKRIALAVRDCPQGGTLPLDNVFEAFLLEGKLPRGYRRIADSPEIAFMERHGHKIPWAFGDVRNNFTTNCKTIIFEQFGRRLPQKHLRALKDIIATEQVRDDGGLGRAFLQTRLPGIMDQYGLLRENEAGRLLRTYTDAVYLSNLPKTIGLNPIYAKEHEESFRLMRGYDYRLEPFGNEVDLKPRLNAAHFTHGLNQLDLDDVHHIQLSDAYRSFARLSRSDSPIRDFDQMCVIYAELNRVIEDRIIERFRHLMHSSPVPDPRKLRRQYGTAFEHGVAIVMDVLSFGFGIGGIPGLISNLVVDAVRGRIDPGRRHLEGARHDVELQRLKNYLETQRKAGMIRFGEEMVRTQSFEKEIIVR